VIAQRRGRTQPELVGALTRTLAGGTWGDRRVAASVLGKLGAGGDPAALVKAATDSKSFVREAVATALGAAPSPGSLEALLALSRDDIAQVRASAALALGTVKDARADKRRAELKSDPEKIVREAAGGS